MKKQICLLISSFFLLTSCSGASGGEASQDTSSNPSDSTTPSSESSSDTESSSSEPAKVLTGISAKFVDGSQVKYESLNVPYGVNIIKDYTFEVLAEYDDATTSELAKTDYEMIIDTAESGKEAINKFREGDYDVVFMDHMMPEMDGVEAMKRIKAAASELHRSVTVIALTANAVSGAREMFIREGFDGFIAKPINLADFERVMIRELRQSSSDRKGT